LKGTPPYFIWGVVVVGHGIYILHVNINCMLFLFMWYGLRIEMFNNMSCCTNYVVAFTFLSFVTEPYYDLYVNKFPAGELSTLLAPNML
jgi:hypothetical protein